jgi:hypothetical protein
MEMRHDPFRARTVAMPRPTGDAGDPDDEPAAGPAGLTGDAAVVETVPAAGKASEVIAWIGRDPARAALALAEERASRRPRTTVVTHAQDVLAAVPAPTSPTDPPRPGDERSAADPQE